ncbi:MAG: energy transducer TonB [Betaproteobacteria bacterium]
MLNIAPASHRYAPAPPLTVEIQPGSAERPSAAPAEPFPPPANEPAPEPHAAATEPAAAIVEPAPASAAPREDAQTPGSRPAQKIVGFSAPQDKYFTLAEIDVRPHPINDVDLVYPVRAYAMRTRGKVLLTIFINEEGAVDNVKIIESTPSGVFEEAALTATLALKFAPGMRYGQRVKSQQTIEVVFDPYETINKP